MIEVKGAVFINPQHLKNEITDIVMGELTSAGYRPLASKLLAQFFSKNKNDYATCAALTLAESIAEEIIMQYILLLPEED